MLSFRYVFMSCMSSHTRSNSKLKFFKPSSLKQPPVRASGQTQPTYCLPSLKLTTAHLPPQAHLRAPLSPPPPSVARSSSSLPLARPTTTSALTVRKERILNPEPGPRGPIAEGKGVVGSQRALWLLVKHCQIKGGRKGNEEKHLRHPLACDSSSRP